MIAADNISFQVGDVPILHNLSVNANSGEIIGILGPNGAGKSTLLKCLSGFETPSNGQIIFEGEPLKDLNLQTLAKKRAVLTQHVAINFPFKVSEIAAMGRGHSNKGNEAEDLKIAKAALELTDTLHLKDRLISSLSGGEQQRVHLARVLAQLWDCQNAVLFLDEPTSALDLKHQFLLFDICHDLATSRNFTIVVVLHDLQLAKQVCDTVLLMQNGREFRQGIAKKILNADTIGALYDVDPARIHI